MRKTVRPKIGKVLGGVYNLKTDPQTLQPTKKGPEK